MLLRVVCNGESGVYDTNPIVGSWYCSGCGNYVPYNYPHVCGGNCPYVESWTFPEEPNLPKEPAPQKIVPDVGSWRCSVCGATHPMWVDTCCAGSFFITTDNTG